MIILLHGALGSASQFDAFLSTLPEGHNVMVPNLSGHGGLRVEQPFSLSLFAESILAALDAEGIVQARFFGYSMGGYVALYMAWKHPDRVEEVVTVNTQLIWSPEVAQRMSGMMNPEKIESKVPAMAARFADMHIPEDWKRVAAHTIDFLNSLGQGQGIPEAAFGQITCPVTILRGANDAVVNSAECMEVTSLLPNGQYHEIPDSGHLWEQVNWEAVVTGPHSIFTR